MNKRQYRLVFNKVRSVLMAVAEITVSCAGKAAGETRGLLGKGFGGAAKVAVGIFGAAGQGAAFRPVTALVWAALVSGGASPASPNSISANFFGKGFAD